MLGHTVGSYQITGTIGNGGMGQVYLAQHTLLGRQAAVKVLLPMFSQDQATVTRFFNEARAATAVRHLGIVEIYDFGYHTDGSAYIAMELLQGESLAARLQRGPMSVAVALGFCRQIAGVLAAAHGKGIVHRDLKPDNIFLVPDPEMPSGERVKLLDFGIAKLTQNVAGANQTRTGTVMGTPAYMAPEQCRGVQVDHRADLYSLGCILFEMMTGRTPFVGEGVGDVLAAHIYVAPPALGTVVADPPVSTSELVRRLLEKDPSARLQTAQDVLGAIDAATDVAPAFRTGKDLAPPAPRAPGPPTTLGGAASEAKVSPSRSRTGLVAAVAVVVVASLVGILIMAAGSGGRPAGTDQAGSAGPVDDRIGENLVPAPDRARVPDVSAKDPTAVPPSAVLGATPTAPAVPTAQPEPTIALAIHSTPAGARVVISGKTVGLTPYRGTLPRGDEKLIIVLSLAGYHDATLTVVPADAVSKSVSLSRKKKVVGGGVSNQGSTNPL